MKACRVLFNEINKLCFIAMLGFIALSCEQFKELEYDIPFEGEQLVVYGFLSNTDSSSLQLYKTQPVLEEIPNFGIEEASIDLLENDNKIETFLFNNHSIYSYFFPHQFNNDYALEITWQNELVRSNSIKVPKPTPIDSIWYNLSEDSSLIDIKIIFKDTNEGTYYDYAIEKYAYGERILEEHESRNKTFLGLFSDDSFENINKEIFSQKKVSIFSLDEDFNVSFVTADSFAIHLYTLSEEFFQFYESKKENSEANLGSVSDANSLLWSNINNGYGFIGGFAKTSTYIKL